jgi:thymidylate synthase (FAD)
MTGLRAEYIDHMGDDLAVVNAARVSFDKESEWIVEPLDDVINDVRLSEADTRLINYLASHNHWTPFAHQVVKMRMGAPVPIRTQAFKHVVGFTANEESRRYISSTPELFMPEHFRVAAKDKKQGSGDKHPDSDGWLVCYRTHCAMAIDYYESMIADGVCPEQARFVLPQGVVVNWIWTGSLAAWARFYKQRTDSHAQKETQVLATAAGKIMAELFPVSWPALVGDQHGTA